jgi:polyhydroxybutyrate depolymerase
MQQGSPAMVNKTCSWSIGFLASLCFLSLSPSSAFAETFYESIESGGRERSFVVVTPESRQGREAVPTVIALHGGLMNGKSMRRIFGLDPLMESGRFAVVYPDGRKRRWNDGREPNRTSRDDLLFLRDLAAHLVEVGLADPKRLYLVGVSNGGMLTFRVACEMPGVFAAYAAIIANMPADVAEDCRRGDGAPMLIINSTDDPVVPWEGGDLGRVLPRGEVLSTPETVEFWRRRNGCSEKSAMKPLPDKDDSDGSTVAAQQFADCRTGSPVVLLSVEGGGHLPPGAKVGEHPVLEHMLGGPANQDISAADIAWKFFRRFPL